MTEVEVDPPRHTLDTGRRQILVLHGGGYRGLYTACVLQALEMHTGASVRKSFDLIAGTSIGGIIALALASGASAADVAQHIKTRGPCLFPQRGFLKKHLHTIRRTFIAPHDPTTLEALIQSAINDSNRPIASLNYPVIVPAVDRIGTESGPEPIIYSNHPVSATRTRRIIDVALATSAAPTYFPAHQPKGTHEQLIDGGVIANSPAWIALTVALARYGWDIDKVHMLIVGTTQSVYGNAPRGRGRTGQWQGFAYWLTRGGFFDLLLNGQQRLADKMCEEALTGERCLKINSQRSVDRERAAGAIDHASPIATSTLEKMAHDAGSQALADPRIRKLLQWKAQAITS